MMFKIVNGKKVLMDQADLENMKLAEENEMKYEAQERHRALSPDEVSELFRRQNIQTLAVDDTVAVRMRSYYPAFEEVVGRTVSKGFKFTYLGELYRTLQESTTFEAQFVPGVGTESLYELIPEQYAGDRYDPIPYHGNVELVQGLYYTQDSTLYLCTRVTGMPVFQTLKEMEGIYVEKVDEI